MQSERIARIGGLTFRFSGWMPSSKENDNLKIFLVPDGVPDIEIRITRVEDIRYPEGRTPDFTSVYMRCYSENGKTYRYYRHDLEETGSDYALLTYPNENPDSLELLACESRRNWDYLQILSCIGIEELLLHHDRAVLHSSWIERDGTAVVFSGRSGIGKSTQARLWNEYRGTPVRNGDRTLLRMIDGAAYACGLPYAGTSGICTNASAPISAIVMLGQGKENHIRRLTQIEAVKKMMTQMPFPKWNPKMMEHTLDVAAKITSSVPVYELICLPDESAVETLECVLK